MEVHCQRSHSALLHKWRAAPYNFNALHLRSSPSAYLSSSACHLAHISPLFAWLAWSRRKERESHWGVDLADSVEEWWVGECLGEPLHSEKSALGEKPGFSSQQNQEGVNHKLGLILPYYNSYNSSPCLQISTGVVRAVSSTEATDRSFKQHFFSASYFFWCKCTDIHSTFRWLSKAFLLTQWDTGDGQQANASWGETMARRKEQGATKCHTKHQVIIQSSKVKWIWSWEGEGEAGQKKVKSRG